MSDLVGNPEDRFSQDEAQISLKIQIELIQGVHHRQVLVVNFFIFLNYFFFALLLRYMTKCTI